MSLYKLIALDMDGTVLDNYERISKRNREAIEKAREAGIIVSFATGRGRQSVLSYVQELGLDTPMVLVNGSEVWETPERLLQRHIMKREWIRELREIALQFDIWYWAYATDGVHNRENWTSIDNDWIKFGFYTEEIEKLQQVREIVIQSDRYEVTNSHPFNLELNPKGVSKAKGLQAICQKLGIDMSQVVAFGDSLNDLEMIQQAGLGVAMGNAQQAVKDAATMTTLTNVEDGVAEVIFQHVLR